MNDLEENTIIIIIISIVGAIGFGLWQHSVWFGIGMLVFLMGLWRLR